MLRLRRRWDLVDGSCAGCDAPGGSGFGLDIAAAMALGPITEPTAVNARAWPPTTLPEACGNPFLPYLSPSLFFSLLSKMATRCGFPEKKNGEIVGSVFLFRTLCRPQKEKLQNSDV